MTTKKYTATNHRYIYIKISLYGYSYMYIGYIDIHTKISQKTYCNTTWW